MLFPLERLLEGRGAPLCVKQDARIREALTLMVTRDYSQLSVVDDQGRLVGIVSERTIVRSYYHLDGSLPLLSLSVDHCKEPAVTLAADRDIFDALDLLRDVAAIVVTRDQVPVGILTGYDTTSFFRDISEGLLHVEDVEVTLRQRIELAFPEETGQFGALMAAFGPDKRDSNKPARDMDRLTLNEYIQLIAHERNWVTNRPRPARLVQLQGTAGGSSRGRSTLTVQPGVETTSKDVGLTTWLGARPDNLSDVSLSWHDIEKLQGAPLPAAAGEHRSWWDNDPVDNPQSRAWLAAGWRVEDVDLAAREVIFHRTIMVLRQLFYLDTLERLKIARPGLTNARRPEAASWWSFGAGRVGFNFSWVFGHRDLRVEFVINIADHSKTLAFFDRLKEQKIEIEKEIGASLNWDDKEGRRASTLSAHGSKRPDMTLRSPRIWPANRAA